MALDLLLRDVGEVSSTMPICRKFTKSTEAEYFCRLPLKAAMTLGTEVGLDQVDYLENIKTVDESAILFTSYIEQDKNCVYKTTD